LFQESLVKAKGPTCPMCDKTLGTASLQMQLECQIREHIYRYYEGWTVCDDATCGNRARMMSVYGWRCLKDQCGGTVSFEVGSS
jgi:DNA polymerase alpha subunit A